MFDVLPLVSSACLDGRLGVCDGVSGVQKMGGKLSNFRKKRAQASPS